MQTRGLIVLLIAKSAADSLKSLKKEKMDEIHHKQTSLAEMTEIINHAYTIHTAVLNIPPSDLQSSKSAQELHHVNKMSVLLGDFLLASVMRGLGEIRNTDVVELMSTAIGDYMEGRFLVHAESPMEGRMSGESPDTIPADAVKYWEERNFLRIGSLQANSCRSVLVLGDHADHLRDRAYEFGKNFSLAWQAFTELQPFLKSFMGPVDPTAETYDIMSAPILLHMDQSGQRMKSFQIPNKEEGEPAIDYEALHHAVSTGSGISKTKDLIMDYSNKALDALDSFTPSESVTALANVVYAVREV